MGNRVDALEIVGRQLSDIPVDGRDSAILVSPESAILVEFYVNAHHFMSGRLQPVDEGAADVAPVPRYQDPHHFTPTFSRELCPGSIVRRAAAFHAGYPYIARTRYGGRPRAAPQRRAVPMARAPNLSRRPRCTRRCLVPARRSHRLSIRHHH